MATINIAVATDIKYLPWCAALVRSCLDQHGADAAVHVLHDDSIEPTTLQPLAAMVDEEGAEFQSYAAEHRVVGLPSVERFGGRAALLRLLLPELLDGLDRVLYLDVDTLILEPLNELCRTSLDGYPIGAVRNVVDPIMYPHVNSLGVDVADVFNSGVMLMDIETVGPLFRRTIEVLEANPGGSPWFDQDALNEVFAGRWKVLHPRWNAMNSLWMWPELAGRALGELEVTEAKQAPAILHFEGPAICKPWHYLCDHQFRTTFRNALARTPWGSTSLVERSGPTWLIKRLPGRWRAPAYWWLRRRWDPWVARSGR